MKKNMRKLQYLLSLLLVLILGTLAKISFAQQDALNTQYVMNKLFINPAYAGYKEQPTFVALHRSQWVGFKGAPTTQVFSFDMPLKADEFAVGGTLLHDKVGPTSRLSLSADFAYRMRLSNRATLCFGMKATGEIFQANLTDVALHSDFVGQEDDAFMYNTEGLFLPNIGFGVYYHKKTHYLGVSIPRLIRNKLDKKGTNAYEVFDGRQEPTLILTGGKMYKVNRQVKLQPNFVARTMLNAPISLGLFLNMIYLDQFTIGGFCFVQESAGLLFQWQVNKQFRIGYSADVATNSLITTNVGSHELCASFTVATRKKRIIYPRYF
jgi:type IX secretion system PorP/SprF family membrane protein